MKLEAASASASASSAGIDGDVHQLRLVNCPDCGHRVIRLQSKQEKTFGEYFFKCEENEQVSVESMESLILGLKFYCNFGDFFLQCKDDPTSCGFYKWEKQYRKWLLKNFHVDDLVHDVNSQMRSTTGRGQVGEQDEKHTVVELKHEIVQLKHEFVQLKNEISHLKLEISSFSTKCVKSGVVVDSVSVFSALVGCMIAILVAYLCK